MKIKHLLLLTTLSFMLSHCGLTNKTTLYFSDGTEKSGFGKLGADNNVKFKTANSKAEFYGAGDVKRFKIAMDNEDTFYRYIKSKNSERLNLVEELALGKVDLFKKVTHSYSGGGFTGPGGGFSPGYSYSISNYYVRKEGEQEATHLGSTNLFSKSFKKAASAYFKDCTSLVQKIQDRTFKKRDIEKVAAYYNRECN